MKQFEDVVA